MTSVADSTPVLEHDFARAVDALDGHPARQIELMALLDEAHPVYRQCGAAAVTRMRGWTLLVLARQTLPTCATVHVLEDLQTGRAAYAVACAARALRSVPSPKLSMASVILQAAANVRATDDYVDLDRYGGATDDDDASTAFDELLIALAWLGATISGVRQVVESALTSDIHGLSPDQMTHVEVCLAGLRKQEHALSTCCESQLVLEGLRRWLQRAPGDTARITFEDQDGNRVRYAEFFCGCPTIVVFFYTRCDNAGKCSLTVSKLARIQSMLAEQTLGHLVQTAAITYDADYDLAPRLRGYAESRGVQMSTAHRVMRTTEGAAELQAHFELGVGFMGSIVNRHRIEAFLVDSRGRITTSFTRLQWDEDQVMAEALALVGQAQAPAATTEVGSAPPTKSKARAAPFRQGLAPPIYLAIALLPKCPICGATYLSLSGIMALPQLPGLYWMVPALSLLTIVNLASLAWIARTDRDWRGLVIASMGAAITLVWGVASDYSPAIVVGIAVTLAGSLIGVSKGSLFAVCRDALRHLSNINKRVWTRHETR